MTIHRTHETYRNGPAGRERPAVRDVPVNPARPQSPDTSGRGKSHSGPGFAPRRA